MKYHFTRIRPAVLLAALPALFAAGSAMAQPPARNANIWNGQKHQPTAGEVSGQERGAGAAPTQQQRNPTDQELDQLNRKLMDRSRSELHGNPQGNSRE